MTRHSAANDPPPSRFESVPWVVPVAAAFTALAAWEIAARLGAYPTHLFPPPTAVLRELFAGFRSGEFVGDLSASGRRWAAGLTLGSLLGTGVGLATGMWRTARRAASPLLHFVRVIPFMMLMPLSLLWFGIGETSKIMFAAWGAFFPVWLATESAVLGVEKEYIWAARTLGAEGPRLWFEVYRPSCLPGIATGVRQAVATSMFALAAAEMVGSFDGIAYRAFYCYQLFQSEKMMACIILVGIVGFGADRLFVLTARRLLPWREGDW